MACDPNELIEQAKCLNACIPQGMLPAVNTSLLCQILEAGGGGGGEFVLKTGDTMSGTLAITVPNNEVELILNNGTDNSYLRYSSKIFSIVDVDETAFITFNGNSPSSIGFFGAATAVLQTSGANLTNNVTVGGVSDTIADFTNLTVYATDAAAIRNDIYQLARKLKQINDGLRAYGLFT